MPLTPPPTSIELTQAWVPDFPKVMFAAAVAEKYPFIIRESWPSMEPAGLAVAVLTSSGGELKASRINHSWFVEKEGAWAAYLDVCDGWWSVFLAAADEGGGANLLAAIQDVAPRNEPDYDDGYIELTLWTENLMTGGGRPRVAQMKVGGWDDVAGNYSTAVAGQLGGLATGLPTPDHGGILVFCGIAGTGKTRAVEALAHSWRDTVELHYIVDSDRLLTNATYLADVLANASTPGNGKRSVVVAEDADDVILAGPKSASVSKLLNVADGLAGRALGGGLMFLLTANAQADELADYITRPGRAAAVVEFGAFDIEEANAWLTAKGIEHRVEGPATLADLFQASRTQ